ncbi:uncharacterized protein CCOS01_02767 [Colletotrichum costaricense]|uniref:Uncharacterized protein n=1 Tax=Colletotrichum costaricense TaxID=1209916 RepID=A0AAI9Z882_9PEZI|nr:uncharacterized protein CCOS01_02767 [Colletotrichum costaricense]KAK1537447.1 hypothetical protein CCOS01_02767 [Colletotrichum costaricense]
MGATVNFRLIRIMESRVHRSSKIQVDLYDGPPSLSASPPLSHLSSLVFCLALVSPCAYVHSRKLFSCPPCPSKPRCCCMNESVSSPDPVLNPAFTSLERNHTSWTPENRARGKRSAVYPARRTSREKGANASKKEKKGRKKS